MSDIENKLELNNEGNDKFEDSCELYISTVTLSNWYDEMKDGNGIGVMIRIGIGVGANLSIFTSKIKTFIFLVQKME